jgi:multiple sugar transport system substrate-binding protein
MAYGYTLLAPYFELDEASPRMARPAICRIRTGRKATPVAPVGGYVLGIPAQPAARTGVAAAVEALIAFTSPGAQKLYVQNGSRTAPRYSVGADPEVRRLSPIFEAVDQMSWRDELQFWPRPPIPANRRDHPDLRRQELHDMLRGIVTPRTRLQNAQKRAEQALREKHQT